MLCPACGRRIFLLAGLFICSKCRYAALEWEFLAKCRANGHNYHMEGENIVFEDDRLFRTEV